jgi:F-box domain
MGRGEDRISNLPNEILQFILCLLPLKYAIRTSTLSKKWVHLWQISLISSTSLQFSEKFSCNQSPKQFAATLNRYLRLHGDRNLDKFEILFSPFEYFFPNLENWVRVVLAKGVRELDIDLSQGVLNNASETYMDGRVPFLISNSLFDCNSLTHLSLSRCDFSDPFDVANFVGLSSLSLDHVNLTDEMLSTIIENCVFLQSISLKRCHQLEVVKFVGDKLRLKKIAMVHCADVNDIEISAPELESFVYHGWLYLSHAFGNVSKVVDVYLCSRGFDDPDDEIVGALRELSHVKVLTICSYMLAVLSQSLY